MGIDSTAPTIIDGRKKAARLEVDLKSITRHMMLNMLTPNLANLRNQEEEIAVAKYRIVNISRYNTNLQKIQNISKLDYSGICKNSNNNLNDLNDICSIDEPNENSQYEI